MLFERTNNYAQYLEYLSLKGNFSVVYKDIDLVKACSVDIADVLVCLVTKNLKEIATCFLKQLKVEPLVDSFLENDIVLSFNFPKRKDHLRLAQKINESLHNSDLVELQYKYSLKTIIPFFKYYSILSKRLKKSSMPNIIYVAAKMSSYHVLIDSLDAAFGQIDLASKKYIGFLSSAYTECLLTLYFNSKGVKTYHIFHGILGKYLRFISNDIVNAENIVADSVLAFSKGQRDYLINDFQIPVNKVFIAGNPKYPDKGIKVSTEMMNCAVLCGISYYDDSFAELVPILNEIALEEDINFTLKPHPLSKLLDYPIVKSCKSIKRMPQSTTIQNLLQSGKYDFAIVHNTTTYYECMYYGVIPLRWGRDENLDFNGFEDKFYDKESLLNLINRYRCVNAEEITLKFKELLVQELGMGINNYNSLINGL